MRIAISVILLLALFMASAYAADISWDGGDGDWDQTATNWEGGTTAWDNFFYFEDIALFDSSSGTVTVGETIDLGGIRTSVGGYTVTGSTLNFGSSQGSLDTSALGTSGSNSFTLNSALTGSAGLTIASHGNLSASGGNSSAQTVVGGDNTGLSGGLAITSGLVYFTGQNAVGSNDITLSNGGGLLHSGAASTTIALNNNIAVESSGATMRAWGSGRRLQLDGILSGTGDINKTDGGILRLNNANNTFQGNINVQGGILEIGDETSNSPSFGTAAAISGSTISIGSGAQLYLRRTHSGGYQTTVWSVPDISIEDGGKLTFSSSLGSNKHETSANIAAAGNTTIERSGGSYTQDLDLKGDISGSGNLTFTYNSGSSTRRLYISGDNNTFSGKTIFGAASGPVVAYLNQALESDFEIGSNWTMELGQSSHDIGSLSGLGNLRPNTSGSTLTVNQGADGSYSGVMSDNDTGSLSLVKAGAGRLTLDGVNTYSGGTTVSSGILDLGDTEGTWSAGNNRVGSGAVTIEAGAELVTGAAFQIDGRNLSGHGSNDRTLNVAGTLSLFDGEYINAINLTGGLVRLADGGTSFLRDPNTGMTISALAAAKQSVVSKDIEITRSDSITFSVDSGATDGLLVSGAISQIDATARGVNKTGAGVLHLSADNTYTGITDVQAGTLVVDGSLASAVTAETGTIVGGSGAFNGGLTMNAGSTLSPGNSPGTMTVGGDLTLDNADLAIDIWGLGGAGDAAGHDQIVFSSGSLILSNNPTITVDLGATFNPEIGASFTIVSGGGTGWAVEDWGAVSVDNAPASWTSSGKTFEIGSGSLILTVIPEPATMGLFALAGLIYMLRRRRIG